MKTTTITLTETEVRTVYKALKALLEQNRKQVKRDLLSEGAKKNLELEMERCMILLDFDGEVFEAWKRMHTCENNAHKSTML